MKLGLLFSTVTMITALSLSAQAGFLWFGSDEEQVANEPSKKVEEVIQEAMPNAPTQQMYNEIFESTNKSLALVEQLISEQKYGQALGEAKSILDNVRIKAGVDPKAKYSEVIKVKEVLLDRDLSLGFTDLSKMQQDQIAQTVSRHKGGYYLDLLNLTKRANLLYQKAKLLGLAQKGNLSTVDKSEIKVNLLKLVHIPMYIRDSQTSEAFLIFDSDVAREEQVEMFNHEVADVVASQLETNAENFKTEAQELKSASFNNYKSTVAYISSSAFKDCQDIYSRQAVYVDSWIRQFTNDQVKKICLKGAAYAKCVRNFQIDENKTLRREISLNDAMMACSSVR